MTLISHLRTTRPFKRDCFAREALAACPDANAELQPDSPGRRLANVHQLSANAADGLQ